MPGMYRRGETLMICFPWVTPAVFDSGHGASCLREVEPLRFVHLNGSQKQRRP